MLKIPSGRIGTCFTKWLSDLDWRVLLLIIPCLSLLAFLSISAATNATSNPLSSFSSLRSLFLAAQPRNSAPGSRPERPISAAGRRRWKEELDRSRIAVCLVGGARRFELTGPSIVERVLKEYPNSDLFLNSPVDGDAYKFSLLKEAPKIAAVRLFMPERLPENEAQARVLTAHNSPNGIQGLIQYFNLVEGCLDLISVYQTANNFTYDWIVRTRVDGYWAGPLGAESFVPGKYLVPPGSSYGGLNDRLGIGDLRTSVAALARLSLIPALDQAGFRNLNSEAAFKAQLTTRGVSHVAKRVPFCVVSDRRYEFPPGHLGVPVAAISSPGPLSGAKCRPCKPICVGPCVADVMFALDRSWSWTHSANGSLQLCDAHGPWEKNWEKLFDKAVGKKLAEARKRVRALKMGKCVADLETMRNRSAVWYAPPALEICKLGLSSG